MFAPIAHRKFASHHFRLARRAFDDRHAISQRRRIMTFAVPSTVEPARPPRNIVAPLNFFAVAST